MSRYIQRRRDFQYTNGALTGRTRPTLTWETGLPKLWTQQLLAMTDAPDLFVIYSLGRPVAWYAQGVWTIPDCPFNERTTIHVNIVRRATEDASVPSA